MMVLALLIDGYNLLHATGAVSLARGPTGWAKARQRMLSQIAGALNEEQRQATQVVFDASRSGQGGQEESHFRGITVTYAIGYDEADDLLEEIIRKHPHPRTLTVVTSDSRVQRCAQARRAQVVGSDQWLMQIMDAPTPPAQPEPIELVDEKQLPNEEEVKRWMKEFGM